MSHTNAFQTALTQAPFLLLDGALATELEARGCNIADKLWSAGVLINHPDLIKAVHLDYFRAGARCAITASYQASTVGFAEHGLSESQSLDLIQSSVRLAIEARQQWQQENPHSKDILLVAGSVGPYGAYLADGSEYRGDYQRSQQEFQAFHRPRIQALLAAGADLLACETMPSYAEIEALGELLSNEFPSAQAWVSLTLRDERHLSDGTPLSKVVALLHRYPQIVATGINCIALNKTTAALRTLQQLTDLPLVVYPNSGEHYDAQTKTWSHSHEKCEQLVDYLADWRDAGARLIGGCCRTKPQDIQALAAHINE